MYGISVGSIISSQIYYLSGSSGPVDKITLVTTSTESDFYPTGGTTLKSGDTLLWTATGAQIATTSSLQNDPHFDFSANDGSDITVEITSTDGFSGLTRLWGWYSFLTSADMSVATNLTNINIRGNSPIGNFDLTPFTDLTIFNADVCLMTSVDISNNTELVELNIYDNSISGSNQNTIISQLDTFGKTNGFLRMESDIFTSYGKRESIDGSIRTEYDSLVSKGWDIYDMPRPSAHYRFDHGEFDYFKTDYDLSGSSANHSFIVHAKMLNIPSGSANDILGSTDTNYLFFRWRNREGNIPETVVQLYDNPNASNTYYYGLSSLDEQYHQYGYTYSTTGGISIYIDGVEVSDGADNDFTGWDISAFLQFGKRHTFQDSRFNGEMKRVLKYDRELTPTEMSASNADLGSVTSGLELDFNHKKYDDIWVDDVSGYIATNMGGVTLELDYSGSFVEFQTTSTSATWAGSSVVKSGDTMEWEAKGGGITTQTSISDNPSFNLSANTGSVIIRGTAPDGLSGLTKLDFRGSGIHSGFVSDATNLQTLVLLSATNMYTAPWTGNLTSLTDLSVNASELAIQPFWENNTLLTKLAYGGNSTIDIDPDITMLPLLEHFSPYDSPIANVNLISQSLLTYIQCNDMTNLTSIDLSHNPYLDSVYFDDSALTSGSMDDIINTLAGFSVEDGHLKIQTQTTGDSPTSASAVSYETLINRGWTVELDTPPTASLEDVALSRKLGELNLTSYGITHFGLTFSPDGYNCYFISYSDDVVRRINLTTPWDITTGTVHATDTYDVTSQASFACSLEWKHDGSGFFVGDIDDVDAIYGYDCAASWSLSGSSYSGESYSLKNELGLVTPRSIQFTQSGSVLYCRGYDDVDLQYYLLRFTMDTPYDIANMEVQQKRNLTHWRYQSFSIDKFETSLVLGNQTDDNFTNFKLPTPGDIMNMYEWGHYRHYNDGNGLEEIYLKPDGGKIWKIENDGEDIHEYEIVPTWPVTDTGSVHMITTTKLSAFNLAQFQNDNSDTYTWTWTGAVTGSTTQTGAEPPTIDFSANTGSEWIYIKIETDNDWAGCDVCDLWATAGGSEIRYIDVSNLTSLWNYNTRYANIGHFNPDMLPSTLTDLVLRGNYQYPVVDLRRFTSLEYYQHDVNHTTKMRMPVTASIDDFRAYSGNLLADQLDYIINSIWGYVIGTTGNLQLNGHDETASENSFDSFCFLTGSSWTTNLTTNPPNYHCTPFDHAASIHETDAVGSWVSENSSTVAISTDNTGSLKFAKTTDLSSHSVKVTSTATANSGMYITAQTTSGSVYQIDYDAKVDTYNGSDKQHLFLPTSDWYRDTGEYVDLDQTTFTHYTTYATALDTTGNIHFRACFNTGTADQDVWVDNLIVKEITEHADQLNCTGIGIENERDSLGNWVANGVSLSVEKHQTYGSEYALRIQASDTGGSNRAELTWNYAESGSSYTVEFDYKYYWAGEETPSPRVKSWTGVVTSPDVFLDTKEKNKYHSHSLTVTANSDTVLMRFYVVAGIHTKLNDVLFIDNLTVTKN